MDNVNNNSHENKFSVMLPCEPGQFKEFISGLLGKPQTITQNMRGVFSIAKQDVINFNYLITQRIEQQNHGTLVQFTIRIVFDDGSSVLLNSLADIETYHEIRPVISTQVHLSWVFLLQFKDRSFPEKQVIDVSFTTGGGSVFSYERGEEVIVRGLGLLQQGSAAFRIQHTARTWGSDMQALLDNHLKSILVKESSLRVFLRNHSGKFSVGTAFIIFLWASAAVYRHGQNLIEEQNRAVLKIKGVGVDVLSKLDYLINTVSTGLWERFFLVSLAYTLIAFVLSLAIGILIETRADTTHPSFILLTPKAELNKTTMMGKYNSKLFQFIASIAIGLFTGIVGNYIYAHYIN